MRPIPSWDDIRKVLGSSEMTGIEIAGRLGAFPHHVGEVIAAMWMGDKLVRTDHVGHPDEVINAARSTWRLNDAEQLALALEMARQ